MKKVAVLTLLMMHLSLVGTLQAQELDPLGDDFQVNTYTTFDQRFPAVAAAASGEIVVVWESYGSFGTDTSSFSIQGQRYAPPIFADDFEAGDTSAWSATTP